jgi:hypothetical protein
MALGEPDGASETRSIHMTERDRCRRTRPKQLKGLDLFGGGDERTGRHQRLVYRPAASI